MSRRPYLRGRCQHCDGHLEFPADAAGDRIECPHCEEKTDLIADGPAKGSPRLLMAGVAVLALAAGLAGFWWHQKKAVASPAPPVAATPAVPPANANSGIKPPAADETVISDFAISGIKLEREKGSSLVYVTGKVRNLTERQRFGVKVELKLFDAQDQLAGKTTDYHSVLEPHGTWKFKALVLESKTASAALDDVIEEH